MIIDNMKNKFLIISYFKSSVILLTVLMFCNDAFSSEKEKIKDSFFLGVGIHLGQKENKTYNSPEDVKTRLLHLGVNSTRDDLPWSVLEASNVDDLDKAIGKMYYGLNNIDAVPVVILKGDRKVIPNIQPSNDTEIKDYLKLAEHSAKILKAYNPIFEIWNEWNLASRKDYRLGSAEKYVELLKQVYPVIKENYPSGTVLAGASGDDRHWEWTLKIIELGALDYSDGISVHPYNYCDLIIRRTGWNVLYSVKLLNKQLREKFPNKNIPIYITEIGWPDMDRECSGLPQKDIADNFMQIILEAPTLKWLKGVWIYELLDQGIDINNREHHFGLYDRRQELKLAGCSVKTAWNFISDTYSPILYSPYPKVNYVIYNTDTNIKRYASWNMNNSTNTIWIRFPETTNFVSICGAKIPNTESWIKLGKTPILAELPKDDISKVKFKRGLTP